MIKINTLTSVTCTEANTAYPLSESRRAAASITIQADYNNAGTVCIGDSTVIPDTGLQIKPGESAVIEFTMSANFTDDFDLSDIYVTSATSGDSVRVTTITRR